VSETLNLEAAAAYTGLSPHTVRWYAKTGRIAYSKPGRRLLFRREDLDRFVRTGRVEPTQTGAA
jgi:excisionase family DNA binding protein